MADEIIITNHEFYIATEASIRNAMKFFESGLVPIAEQAVEDGGFNVGSYPVEGYYCQTPKLTRYFNCIRTLQDKYTEKITPAIQKLHDIYTHPVFGLKQGKPTAINKIDVYYPEHKPVTISPVVDPLHLAMQRPQLEWTICSIMQNIEQVPMGTCLVGLAVLADQKEKQAWYNPVATCMAAETTVLSRMKAMFASYRPPRKIDWRVDPQVEAYAKEVVASYNDLLQKHLVGKQLLVNETTPDNVETLLNMADSAFRCVNIGFDTHKEQHYHWAIIPDQSNLDRLKVVEFFHPEIMTTEQWQMEEMNKFLQKS